MAVHETATRYASENGVALIEIRLSSVQQLFSSLDPAPFHEKDLDPDAEEYITGAVNDFPVPAPLKIVLYLPPDQLELVATEGLANAVHNYFGYRLALENRRLRAALREGRISLLIGLAFLFACVALRELVHATIAATTLREILAEGLLISGWVAMWRPIQIFLYDWWPFRRRCRVYAKLERIPIEIRAA